MLRLQPYNYERFVQCDHVEFTFGGGEANVAVSLANYGLDAAYVTTAPLGGALLVEVDAHTVASPGDEGGVHAVAAEGVMPPIKKHYIRRNYPCPESLPSAS
mgnify:CR=1 FL=1